FLRRRKGGSVLPGSSDERTTQRFRWPKGGAAQWVQNYRRRGEILPWCRLPGTTGSKAAERQPAVRWQGRDSYTPIMPTLPSDRGRQGCRAYDPRRSRIADVG